MRLRELRLQYVATDPAVTIDGRAALSTPTDAAAALRPLLEDEPCEVFAILLLNTKHRAIGLHVVSRGTLDSTTVHPREVFKAAIVANAAAIITAHNHPSGDQTPSPNDLAAWTRLDSAAAILGIDCLDHLVIGHDGRTFSARAAGHMVKP